MFISLFLDINECIEEIDRCAQGCTDTLGSYTCSCGPGYRLASDDHQCDGMYGLSLGHCDAFALLST